MYMEGFIVGSYGQHRLIVYINEKTLEDAKYVVKTQLKITDTFYKYCQLIPIYGI